MESHLLKHSTAIFSPCRTWRYTLTRRWNSTLFDPIGEVASPARLAAFIGLNPSTADETQDDPTVRRCIQYAKDWGYGGMVMLNIFAFRATDPRVMMAAPDPVGPDNNRALLICGAQASIVVAAWGTHGNFQNRHQNILKLFQEAGVTLHCLKKTKDGLPGHPLYLRRDLVPVIYEGP